MHLNYLLAALILLSTTVRAHAGYVVCDKLLQKQPACSNDKECGYAFGACAYIPVHKKLIKPYEKCDHEHFNAEAEKEHVECDMQEAPASNPKCIAKKCVGP